jgi:Na+-transporting NADH:ubiquinone oxidoreductase subunit NqrB
MLVTWILSAFIGFAVVFIDILVPSYKQIFDIIEEMMMELNQSP